MSVNIEQQDRDAAMEHAGGKLELHDFEDLIKLHALGRLAGRKEEAGRVATIRDGTYAMNRDQLYKFAVLVGRKEAAEKLRSDEGERVLAQCFHGDVPPADYLREILCYLANQIDPPALAKAVEVTR